MEAAPSSDGRRDGRAWRGRRRSTRSTTPGAGLRRCAARRHGGPDEGGVSAQASFPLPPSRQGLDPTTGRHPRLRIMERPLRLLTRHRRCLAQAPSLSAGLVVLLWLASQRPRVRRPRRPGRLESRQSAKPPPVGPGSRSRRRRLDGPSTVSEAPGKGRTNGPLPHPSLRSENRCPPR